MSTLLQRSFAGGEIAPTVHSRSDMVKYATGLHTCRNFIVMRHGGVTNRPGTKFLGEKEFKSGNDNIRLEPFTFISTAGVQTKCILEFGHQYMRVWVNDAHVTTGSAKTITGATAADPVVITATAHGFANGDLVTITGVVGMVELNGRDFLVSNQTANTFEIQDMQGTDIDGSGYTAYSSAGSAIEAYTLTTSMTDITSARLADIQMYQNGNSIYMAHPDWAPKILTATATNNWSISALTIGSGTTAPTGVTILGPSALRTITNATQADPVVITSNGHGLKNNALISISGVAGMTELNGNTYRVSEAAANTFELHDTSGADVDGSGFTAYSSGGTITPTDTTDYVVTAVDSTTLEESPISSVVKSGQPAELPVRIADTAKPGVVFQLAVETNAQVEIVSTDDETGVPFIVSGYDSTGAFVTEPTITNVGMSPVTTTKNFWVVTYVLVSNATTGTISVGISGNSTLVYAGSGALVGPTYLQDTTDWNSTTISESSPNTPAIFGRKILLQSDANESSITFRITGTDHNDQTITEDITGPVADATVSGTKYFKTITLVNADSAPNGRMDIGVGEAILSPVTIAWAEVSGALEYNVYKSTAGIYGLIGVTTDASFKDTGITPDFTSPPPVTDNPFNAAGDYPSEVSVFQQRLWFGNTDNNPTKIHGSKLGFLANFNYSRPLQNDDALEFSILQKEYGTIRHIIDLGKMVVLTQTGEFVIQGDAAGAITPLDINPAQHGYYGSSTVSPITIGGNAIFLQQGSRIVRDLGFDFNTDGYRGNDLTVFAAHLFDNYTITELAYQQTPHSVVWAVRSDGTLLGLTYLPEHQIWGWHRHDFQSGTVDEIATLQENNEDFLYAIVTRTINGASRKYIERMTTRLQSDTADYIFMDSALTYNGYNDSSITLTVTGGTDWDGDETLTMTASSAIFTSADVGKEVHLYITDRTITGATQANPVVITSASHGFLNGEKVYISGVVGMTQINNRSFTVANVATDTFELQGEDGTGHTAYSSAGTAAGNDSTSVVKVEFSVDAFSSTTVVTGKPNRTLPAGLRNVAVLAADWALAVNSLTNLWHLEGEQVAVFADGAVEASPNNSDYDILTVSSGTITLSQHYGKVHVGLPILYDVRTLDIDSPQGETLVDKKKLVTKVSMKVDASRGVWVGPNAPTNDQTDAIGDLIELKIRDAEDNYDPVGLATGVIDVNILPEWNSGGSVFVRVIDPVPFSLLGIAPSLTTAFRGHGGQR